MELRQLRYFVAVARRRHFTAAAEALHVAQPALSQQIRALEDELHVRLLDRTSHRVRLTPAGETFLPRAERVLAEAVAAATEMGEFAGLTRGRLTVGAVPSLAERQLPSILAAYHAQYPGIELVLREESTAALMALVRAGEADVALVNHDPGAAGTADVAVEPLFAEDLVGIVSPQHHLAAQGTVALATARDEPFILTKQGSLIRHTVLQACAAAGFTPHIAFESDGMATVRALAAAGLGLAVLPRSDALAAGPAVTLLALTPALTRTVALAWSAERYRPIAAEAFVALARAV